MKIYDPCNAVLLSFCLSFSLVRGSSFPSSLQIVNSKGTCRSKEQVLAYFNNNNDDNENNTTLFSKVIEVIDCTTDHKQDRSLVNRIFGTKFVDNINIDNGVYLDVSLNQCAVLYSSFDSLFSTQFCGSQAVDYFHSLSSSVTCFVLKAVELPSVLLGYDQLFRRLVKLAADREGGGPMEVVFVLDTSGVEESSLLSLSEKLTSYLEGLVPQVLDNNNNNNKKLSDLLTLRIETEGLDGSLTSRLVPSDSPNTSLDVLSDLLTRWTPSPTKASPVLSPSQREALFRVEEAFSLGLAELDRALLRWQRRVSSGRVVGRFSESVSQVGNVCLDVFRLSTAGSGRSGEGGRERVDRLRLLQEHLQTGVARLVRQQESLLESEVTKDLRESLVELWERDEEEVEVEVEDVKRKEEIQQLLRKSVFQFQAKAAELGEVSESRLSEIRESLSELVNEFPESSSAKLAEVRRLDKQAKRGSGGKGKGKKRFTGLPKLSNLGLSLVGMLRPPGYGNLQGFVGYATSLLGLPLELLLGVHNDGDSPEIMGDDREYPVLRLQPKVNFDIDF